MKELIPFFTTTIQIITAILSLLLIKRRSRDFVLIMSVIFCLSGIVEVLGIYYIKIKRPSHGLYNTYSFFLFNLIALAYSFVIKYKRYWMVYFLVIIFNVLFFVFYYLELSYFYSVIIGSFNTSFFAFLYLRELLLSDRIINYKKMFPFWVSVGFLVFYLPSIPFFSLFKDMTSRGLFYVLYLLIILMNLIIIYGLITCNKEEKY